MMHPNTDMVRGGRVRCGPFDIEELAEISGAECYRGKNNNTRPFKDVASLERAQREEVSFLSNRHYLNVLQQSQAGLVVMSPSFKDKMPDHMCALLTKDPYLAWARIVGKFYPRPAVKPFRHPTASIDPQAIVDPQTSIGAYVVIEKNAHIEAGVSIGAHSFVGQDVTIGRGSFIAQHVTLNHCCLGKHVKILPGTRIGQEGFGFASSSDGFETIPQLGGVTLGDDVEIGANCTIDRGSLNDTVIGRGTRIDNLVQIGHNVQMGNYCIVVSQAGISGSTVLEDNVVMAAQAGLVGHIRIGAGARIGAQCGVMSDVAPREDVIGSPAMPFREFFRNVAYLRKITKASHAPKDH